MTRILRNQGAPFQAQMALAAVKEDKTLAELADQLSVHPTQIPEWEQQLLGETQTCLVGRRLRPRRMISRCCTQRSGNWPSRMIFLESTLTKTGLLSAKR